MLIYSENISSRLIYTLDFIFKDIVGINYTITNDLNSFVQANNYKKISYSKENYGGVHISPKYLLFETNIEPQKINFGFWKGYPTLYHSNKSDIPFDLFSATFFLISRYEEYLPHKKDKHERFLAEETIAYNKSFLHLPIVNIWIDFLVEILDINYSPDKKYSSITTFDIDNSYAYRGKGLKRFSLSLLKDIYELKPKNIAKRLASLINIKNDPCNSYNYIFNKIDSYKKNKSLFFILNGSYSSMDKNLPITSGIQKKLLKSISNKYEVGIHPSFQSNKKDVIQTEIESLENVINKKIEKSRQHFLMLEFPKTYKRLIKNNIKEDYSMGFSECLNFRASTCTPFYWFDLVNNSKTNLKVFPIGIMDGTLKDYLSLDINSSIELSKKHIDLYKKYNGTFVLLWHNSSFNELEGWKNWNYVFEELLKHSQE